MTETKIETILSESQYRDVAQTLSSKKRPPALLRKLMNSFESYRQGRKYGWSRPWNKYDLMNFQSFKLDMSRDTELLQTGTDILKELETQMPTEAISFYKDLLGDNNLMGFVFCHEFTEGSKLFEGATLSLGRKNAKRYRDRIDIIIESLVVDGVSQGFSRVRIYIDPYREEEKAPLWQSVLSETDLENATRLFETLSSLSWEWAEIPERHWDHWTSVYIDYFGDRQWPMSASYFWVASNSGARISANDDISNSVATTAVG